MPDEQARPQVRRRADAERSASAILEAAVGLLAERPAASMSEVARAAGLTRQTVYAHYPSREALLSAVAERARAQAVAAIDAAEPGEGAPGPALERLIAAWWETVARHARVLGTLADAYPSDVAIRDLHAPIVERLERLARRGQRDGSFDPALPPAWMAAAFLGLMHASADQVAADRIGAADAGRALGRAVPRAWGVGAAGGAWSPAPTTTG